MMPRHEVLTETSRHGRLAKCRVRSDSKNSRMPDSGRCMEKWHTAGQWQMYRMMADLIKNLFRAKNPMGEKADRIKGKRVSPYR